MISFLFILWLVLTNLSVGFLIVLSFKLIHLKHSLSLANCKFTLSKLYKHLLISSITVKWNLTKGFQSLSDIWVPRAAISPYYIRMQDYEKRTLFQCQCIEYKSTWTNWGHQKKFTFLLEMGQPDKALATCRPLVLVQP